MAKEFTNLKKTKNKTFEPIVLVGRIGSGKETNLVDKLKEADPLRTKINRLYLHSEISGDENNQSNDFSSTRMVMDQGIP